jgi:hypothetical protein
MRVRGLIPSEWKSLPRDERTDIIAYEMSRAETRNKIINELSEAMKDKLLTTDVVMFEVLRQL